jgi:superoxide dismutase, Fe-Mn family
MSTATAIKLPPLPYDESALDPVISARTIGFHYGKHHKAYVEKTNKLIEGTKYAEMDLEDIVRQSFGKDAAVFNNAGQVWNHSFYWNSLSPKSSAPSGKLASAIEEFGGLDALKKDMAEKGAAQFGSGWIWLVARDGRLAVEKTANAESPFAKEIKCLLTIDVWEHAYYLDYQNERPRHLKAVLDKLINWQFAADNLSK